MKKVLTILFIVSLFVVSAQGNFNYKKDFKNILAKTKDPKDKLCYDKLLVRYKKNDSSLTNAEMLALLIGYTAKPEYKPYADLEEERAVYNINAEGKYEEGLKKANQFLETHPFSLKVLFEKSFSLYKAGYIDSAKFYAAQGHKIFYAMEYSGNGRTKETPTFALGPADGQDYIYKYVGAGIGEMGSGKDPDGNFLDILEVTSKAGEPYSLYFVIQHATAKMFDEKKKSEK